MSLIQQAKHLLRAHHVFPRKRLGQHFMTDHALLERMISYAQVNDQDVVLEVGPGLGFLTQILSQKSRLVVAVEVDPKLVRLLLERFHGIENIELIEGDILKATVPQFNKLVSTPPYSISSHLLFWLLGRPFDLGVLTFQKEFALRLVASINAEDYGRLTVATYYKADVELLDCVPRTSFYPPPDVDSMVVKLKPRTPPPFKVKDERIFFEIVRAVFTQRNKKLRSAILSFLESQKMTKGEAQEFADRLSFHDKRVREMAPEDFGALADEIIEKTRVLR